MPSRALLSASFINQSNSIPSGYTHSISPWRNYSFKPRNLDVFQRFIIHLNGKNDVLRKVRSSKSVCWHFLSNNLGNVNSIVFTTDAQMRFVGSEIEYYQGQFCCWCCLTDASEKGKADMGRWVRVALFFFLALLNIRATERDRAEGGLARK